MSWRAGQITEEGEGLALGPHLPFLDIKDATIVIKKGDTTSRLAFEVLAAGAELAAVRPRFLGGATSAASSFFSAIGRVSAAFVRAAVSAHRHRTPSAIQQHLLSQHSCPGHHACVQDGCRAEERQAHGPVMICRQQHGRKEH